MVKLFKVNSVWLEGTQIESETRGFKLLLDKPEDESGTNLGPKPAEVTLQALGGCLIFAYLYAAQRLEVAIEGLKIEIEGEIIPGGWTDENDKKHTGFKTVNFKIEVKTKHSQEELQKVHDLALKASPMYDTLVSPVNVTGSFTIQ
ncbi:MAG: OsmC family protein [Candidatus Atribacteria bacterium]|jgi:uncharacterized OsmC-like protein|nr:OsmC family protein [Candidatus Atribacteria bacterium]